MSTEDSGRIFLWEGQVNSDIIQYHHTLSYKLYYRLLIQVIIITLKHQHTVNINTAPSYVYHTAASSISNNNPKSDQRPNHQSKHLLCNVSSSLDIENDDTKPTIDRTVRVGNKL